MTAPAEDIRKRMEERFGAIGRTRMADVPVMNDALEVAALGFDRFNNEPLGVLITPWFMNLVILPDAEETGEIKTGDKVQRALPAGMIEFIVTVDEELGPLLMCSLFSPMFEFSDQAAAVETALAAFSQILEQDAGPSAEPDMMALATGMPGRLDGCAASPQPPDGELLQSEQATEKPATPAALSRRSLFTGGRREVV
ncbi:MAG: [NiFe]-hydrogenase assembly chaperone HybE [Parvularcula sp.]